MTTVLTKDKFAKYVGDAIQTALEESLRRGFQLPLHFMLLAANGSLLVVRAETESRKIVAQHDEPEGWRMPMLLTVVDYDGNGSTFRIRVDGTVESVH